MRVLPCTAGTKRPSEGCRQFAAYAMSLLVDVSSQRVTGGIFDYFSERSDGRLVS